MPLMQQGQGLKPLRNYNEWEVINGIFSSATVPMNQGTVVTIASSISLTNVNGTGTGSAPTPALSASAAAYAGGTPSYASAEFYGLFNSQVRAANSGEVPLGITLVNVSETNKFGESYAARPHWEREEQQTVLSGESVKILTRGWVKTNGFVGTPSASTGAYASGGLLVPCAYNKTLFPQLVGKFLGGVDNDGYALFKIEL